MEILDMLERKFGVCKNVLKEWRNSNFKFNIGQKIPKKNFLILIKNLGNFENRLKNFEKNVRNLKQS